MVAERWATGQPCTGCGKVLDARQCAECDLHGPSLFNEWQYTLELTQLFWDPVFYGFGVPPGDGAPILLLPGFLAGDFSMSVLGEWLRRSGYQVYYPGIHINTDCPDRMLLDLGTQIRRMVEQNGRRIILIGHSKGGYLGRALGHRHPDLIRHVIALGSPFNDPLDIHPFTLLLVDLVKHYYRYHGQRHGMSPVEPVLHHYGPLCYSTACECNFAVGLRDALPKQVRYTAIYSRHDGVVRWRHCLDRATDDNLEVSGTHLGLICNSQVYRHLGQVLARSTHLERTEEPFFVAARRGRAG